MNIRGLKIGTLLGVGIAAIIFFLIAPTIYSNSLSTRAQRIITDSTERIFEAMTIQRDVDVLFSTLDELTLALEGREVSNIKERVSVQLGQLQKTVEDGRERQAFAPHEIERAEKHMAELTEVSARIFKLKVVARQSGPGSAGFNPEFNMLRSARYGMLGVVTDVIQRSDEEFQDAMQLVNQSQIISWVVVSFSLLLAIIMAFLLVRSARKIFDLKNEFINIIAHDLRNPVTAILGYLDMILTTKDMKMGETKKQLKIVEVATHRLRAQINNLLEVGRTDAGYVKINMEAVRASKVLNESFVRAKAFAETKGINIKYDELVGDDVFVMADSNKMADVLDNLISNAIKYNKKEGLVTITTGVSRDKFTVSVADTGHGIPEDQQSKMFKKYSRLESGSKDRVGGTGLGLYTVKLLMGQMKGEVAFKTAKGRGTTFTVTFKKVLNKV